jgi:hypothetical protein
LFARNEGGGCSDYFESVVLILSSQPPSSIHCFFHYKTNTSETAIKETVAKALTALRLFPAAGNAVTLVPEGGSALAVVSGGATVAVGTCPVSVDAGSVLMIGTDVGASLELDGVPVLVVRTTDVDGSPSPDDGGVAVDVLVSQGTVVVSVSTTVVTVVDPLGSGSLVTL